MSYSVIKFPDNVRKQWTLTRHGSKATVIVAYFRTEEHAQTAADEMSIPLYDWSAGWGT